MFALEPSNASIRTEPGKKREMANHADYTAAANAILRVLDAYVNAYVPDIMGYREKALAAMPGVAGAAAKAAVDAVSQARVRQQLKDRDT